MPMPQVDYAQTPFLVIWESTQACDLTCRHCRASAQPHPLPGELSTEEGKDLLSNVKAMGCPIAVISGGDSLKRPDLAELVQHGKSLGLTIATIPAATPLLTRDRIVELKEAKLDQLAFSLDYPTAERHDAFRGTPGAFAKTVEGIEWAHELEIPLQINTTITADSLPYLRQMGQFVSELGIVFWEVFFLVPTGRGSELQSLTARQCEEAFQTLYDVHQECSFILKVTEAPHYRRFVAQRESRGQDLAPRLRRSEGPGRSMGMAPSAVNAGRGFMFVSYKGDIFPSGFLPQSGGNVRTHDLAEVYRTSELFLGLRDLSKLKGVCGACEYKAICGGSRSRAFALTGDILATDPWCAYRPAGFRG